MLKTILIISILLASKLIAADYFTQYENSKTIRLIQKYLKQWNKEGEEPNLRDVALMTPVFKEFQEIGVFPTNEEYTRFAFRLVGLGTMKQDFFIRYLSPSRFEIRYRFNEKLELQSMKFVKEEDAIHIVFMNKEKEEFQRPIDKIKAREKKICLAGSEKVIEVMEEFAYLWATNENYNYFKEGDMHYMPLFKRLRQRGIIPKSQTYNPKDFRKSYVFFSERRGKPNASIKIGDESFTYFFNLVGNKPIMVGRDRVCKKLSVN